MANRRFTQFYNTLHSRPVQLDCNFIVDSTNGNGLGIRSLKGPGIANVYMKTSATPAAGNPNPAAGYIYVQFQDNYNRYYGGYSGAVAPASGSNITLVSGSMVVGGVYIITSLGTTTLAQWQAVGLPIGITPAVGASFVASATTGSGTGVVQAMKAAGSGIGAFEVVGDPNLTLTSSAPITAGSTAGSYMILACMSPTSSSVTTPVVTAPANGSVIGLTFVLSNSSIQVQGE